MTKQSVFEKKYVEKDRMNDVEGLLEHFNLPPKFIAFIRNNVRAVQIGIAVVVIAVAAGSFYKSHLETVQKESASALGLAMQQEGDAQIAALEAVYADYASTDAGLWSQVELGHAYMAKKDYDKAYAQYTEVLKNTSKDDPIYPLLLVAQAESLEAANKFAEAYESYSLLKDVQAFSEIAYLGMARSWEARGDNAQAIMAYNEFMLDLGSEPSPYKPFVEAKLVRLNAQ